MPDSTSSRLSSAVGRVGKLTLEYARHGKQTVLSRSKCRTPWHLLPPIYLDETGAAYTLLLNPSGGLVGGDRLTLDIKLKPKTHVLPSTPDGQGGSVAKNLPSVVKGLCEPWVREC